MGTSTSERAFRSVQLDPAAIDEIADRPSDPIAERVIDALTEERTTPEACTDSASLDSRQVAQPPTTGCDPGCKHAREPSGAIIGSAPRLRQHFPEHVVGSPEPFINQVAGRADHRKEAAT